MRRTPPILGAGSMIVCIAFARTAAGDLIEVPADYATIQAAINSAFDGDVIELADGTYAGSANKNLDFLGKAITLRGNGSDLCTIDCQSSGRAVIFQTGEGPNTRVEGIRLFDGAAGANDGGAALCDGTSPTFVDVTFESNSARFAGAVNAFEGSPTFEDCAFLVNTSMGQFPGGGTGGAVRIDDGTFTGCTFVGNHVGNLCTSSGGAVSCLGDVLFVGCHFQDNTVSGSGPCAGPHTTRGGALYGDDTASLAVFDTTFVDNAVGSGCNAFGGAIYSLGPVTLVDVTFHSNQASGGGSGIGCVGAGTGAVSAVSLVVVRGWFTDNRAQGWPFPFGAPVGALGSNDATVIDSVFIGNSAQGSVGGAAIGSSTQPARIVNSLFISNWSDNGSTAALSANNSQVVNCTFIDNSAHVESGPPGGGTGWSVSATSGGTIANSIIRIEHANTVAINPSSGSVSFSNVQGGWTGAGGGNIDAPPVFADAAALDFRLFYGSPGIDAGRNGSVPADTQDLDGDSDTTEPTPLDLADGPRFVNDPQTPDTGTAHPVYPTLPIVDMGAYEYDPCAMADLDGDGTVGFFELTQLLVHWGPCRASGVTSCPWDRDGDGEVGFNDLTLLLLVWGPCA